MFETPQSHADRHDDQHEACSKFSDQQDQRVDHFIVCTEAGGSCYGRTRVMESRVRFAIMNSKTGSFVLAREINYNT
ncbi:hypothetical protein M8J76_014378 [Diaphorina citri]|nr:hypothetical protein M8J75_010865 [Diaphorina citri]KAI5724029.1 hypothetical protein M8J76_014378 [Diaphorina citri]